MADFLDVHMTCEEEQEFSEEESNDIPEKGEVGAANSKEENIPGERLDYSDIINCDDSNLATDEVYKEDFQVDEYPINPDIIDCEVINPVDGGDDDDEDYASVNKEENQVNPNNAEIIDCDVSNPDDDGSQEDNEIGKNPNSPEIIPFDVIIPDSNDKADISREDNQTEENPNNPDIIDCEVINQELELAVESIEPVVDSNWNKETTQVQDESNNFSANEFKELSPEFLQSLRCNVIKTRGKEEKENPPDLEREEGTSLGFLEKLLQSEKRYGREVYSNINDEDDDDIQFVGEIKSSNQQDNKDDPLIKQEATQKPKENSLSVIKEATMTNPTILNCFSLAPGQKPNSTNSSASSSKRTVNKPMEAGLPFELSFDKLLAKKETLFKHNKRKKMEESVVASDMSAISEIQSEVKTPPDSSIEENKQLGTNVKRKSKFSNIHISSQEAKYRAEFLLNKANSILNQRLHCTICDAHVGIRSRINAEVAVRHKYLLVLICSKCCKFYGTGNFPKDSNYDQYCRWCGEGGKQFLCSFCSNVFCEACIRRNFGKSEVRRIEDVDEWKCYMCDTRPLWHLRTIAWNLLNFIRNKKVALKRKMKSEELADYDKYTDLWPDLAKCCNQNKDNQKTLNNLSGVITPITSGGSTLVASGGSTLVASGGSTKVASGGSTPLVYDGSTLIAFGGSTPIAHVQPSQSNPIKNSIDAEKKKNTTQNVSPPVFSNNHLVPPPSSVAELPSYISNPERLNPPNQAPLSLLNHNPLNAPASLNSLNLAHLNSSNLAHPNSLDLSSANPVSLNSFNLASLNSSNMVHLNSTNYIPLNSSNQLPTSLSNHAALNQLNHLYQMNSGFETPAPQNLNQVQPVNRTLKPKVGGNLKYTILYKAVPNKPNTFTRVVNILNNTPGNQVQMLNTQPPQNATVYTHTQPSPVINLNNHQSNQPVPVPVPGVAGTNVGPLQYMRTVEASSPACNLSSPPPLIPLNGDEPNAVKKNDSWLNKPVESLISTFQNVQSRLEFIKNSSANLVSENEESMLANQLHGLIKISVSKMQEIDCDLLEGYRQFRKKSANKIGTSLDSIVQEFPELFEDCESSTDDVNPALVVEVIEDNKSEKSESLSVQSVPVKEKVDDSKDIISKNIVKKLKRNKVSEKSDRNSSSSKRRRKSEASSLNCDYSCSQISNCVVSLKRKPLTLEVLKCKEEYKTLFKLYKIKDCKVQLERLNLKVMR